MPDPKPYQCRHIFTAGHQCGSPALRGEKLCFYHHASRRSVTHQTIAGLSFLALPAPDDLHAIQRGIAEVLRLASANAIDDRHASLILRGLGIASANLARIERQTRYQAKTDPAQAQIVQDFVHDPLLGTLAPAPDSEAGPDPEARPDGPLPHPLPILTPRPTVEYIPRSKEEDAQAAALYAQAEAERAAHAAARALKPPTDHSRLLEELDAPPTQADASLSVIPEGNPRLPTPSFPRPVQTYPTPNQDFGLRENTIHTTHAAPPTPAAASLSVLPEGNLRLPPRYAIPSFFCSCSSEIPFVSG